MSSCSPLPPRAQRVAGSRRAKLALRGRGVGGLSIHSLTAAFAAPLSPTLPHKGGGSAPPLLKHCRSRHCRACAPSTRRANHVALRKSLVQPLHEKYSDFQKYQITLNSAPSRAHTEGRFAIVTDVGRGMRWTPGAGRRTALRRTAKSCGPDAPTLASNSQEANFPGVTVAKEPGHRGEHEIRR